MRITALCFATALTVVIGTTSHAATFNSVVQTVLVKQPRIAELTPQRRREMIACVQKVLEQVPRPKQQYVAEARDYNQMEDRFGEVVLADRAKFKQRITQQCGGIVASK